MARIALVLSLGALLMLAAEVSAEKCKTDCSLSFIVVNCSNEPVEGVPIELTFRCGRQPAKMETDAKGKAVFEKTCASDVASKKIGQLATRKLEMGGQAAQSDEEILEMRIQLCSP